MKTRVFLAHVRSPGPTDPRVCVMIASFAYGIELVRLKTLNAKTTISSKQTLTRRPPGLI